MYLEILSGACKVSGCVLFSSSASRDQGLGKAAYHDRYEAHQRTELHPCLRASFCSYPLAHVPKVQFTFGLQSSYFIFLSEDRQPPLLCLSNTHGQLSASFHSDHHIIPSIVHCPNSKRPIRPKVSPGAHYEHFKSTRSIQAKICSPSCV